MKVPQWLKLIWKDPVLSSVIATLICFILGGLGAWIYSKISKIPLSQIMLDIWESQVPFKILFWILMSALVIWVLILSINKKGKEKIRLAKFAADALAQGAQKVTLSTIKVGNHDLDGLIDALKSQWFPFRNTTINAFEVFINHYPDLVSGVAEDWRNEDERIKTNCVRALEAYGLARREYITSTYSTPAFYQYVLEATGFEFMTKLRQHRGIR